MRLFAKAGYFVILGVAVMLSILLGDARAQSLEGPPPQNPPPTVVVPDYLKPPSYLDPNANQPTGDLPKHKIPLDKTMNFEECVDIHVTPVGKACAGACKFLPVPGAWVQYDYYEPIALVESVPKPWSTLFNDTENFISKAFTKFEKTPFGGAEAIQPIHTDTGIYPQRYFEAHVWGLSIPTRFLMLILESATKPPSDPRIMGMINSLTYEIGAIVTEALGLSEITDLRGLLRAIKEAVLTYFSGGSRIMIKTIEYMKAVYDIVKTVVKLVTAILDLIKTAIAWATEPLQRAIKLIVKLVMGYCKGDQDAFGADSVRNAVFGKNKIVNPKDNTTKPDADPLADDSKRCGQGVLDDITKGLKKSVKKLGNKFGDMAKAMQLDHAFSVFKNFTKSIANRLSHFTDGWSSKAGESAGEVQTAASSESCKNRDWLCSAHDQLGSSVGQGQKSPLWGAGLDYIGTPDAPTTGSGDTSGGPIMLQMTNASSAVDKRITDLGGSCSGGKAVGEWGDRVSQCDKDGVLEKFGSALSTVNQVQDIIRAGTIVNMLGAMAGSLLPLGLIPSYLSEFDRPSWNKGTPNLISTMQAAVASMPGACMFAEVADSLNVKSFPPSIKNEMCIGIWGSLYPKVGSVSVERAHLAAGITNFRAFSLAANWGTLPIKYDPQKLSLKFNVDHPFRSKRCYDIGTISPVWDSQIFNNRSAGSAALDAMTGGVAGVVSNMDSMMQAANSNPLKAIQDGAKSDGYVHTYWKKTRACMNVCLTGVKWRKLY